MDRGYRENALLLVAWIIVLQAIFGFMNKNYTIIDMVNTYLDRQSKTMAVMGEQLGNNGIVEAVTAAFSQAEKTKLQNASTQSVEINNHNTGGRN